MASSTEDQQESPENTISDLFDQAFDLYNAINNTTEATNSDQVQLDVRKAIKMLENCTKLVSAASIFSTNESFEELPPNDIKFLLLPVLLGMLHLKICGTHDRKELLDNAEIYFKDYLKRCYEYGLTENDVTKKKKDSENQTDREESEIEIIQKIVHNRSNKIKRYQEQKALDEKIAYLKQNLDEDVKREFFTTLIKSYIYQVIDELNSIDMERPMLEIHLRNQTNKRRTNIPKPPPLKPIIITKDEIQKAVFGAGYPSLPTMTVKEFYDKRVADGIFPDPNKPRSAPMSLQEMAIAGVTPDEDAEQKEEEEKIEQDDEENLARLRAKDEFKDEFRRGYGNRMNRS
ncbi:immunoglobulin-binding protein 1 [Chrysoperla carnea]|uniref:immunoglobulin-binding protein 1 n=1 Tax=Chrysoperla carnea TaxID=189513 RepID=UPI001D05F6AF|nr:immunoglobulin-binding protein 1 [Chrysoperla carnea]